MEGKSPEEKEGKDYWENHEDPERSQRSQSSLIKGPRDKGTMGNSPHTLTEPEGTVLPGPCPAA